MDVTKAQNTTRITSTSTDNPNDLVSRGKQTGQMQREKMLEFYKAHYDQVVEVKAKEFIRKRRNSRIMGLGLLVFIVGVYSYTIGRVSQERFLDDNEPLQKKTPI